MKSIYISLPITGQEDTYEQRLDDAVEYVKAKYPEYERIVTPKELAEEWKIRQIGGVPLYRDYLVRDIIEIAFCDAILMCNGWSHSKGCRAEHKFAKAIDIKIIYQL